MEDGDFNPFSDLAGNPNLPQYLENISQCHDNQIYSYSGEDEFIELQDGRAGDYEDILEFNIESQPESGDQGQHLSNNQRKELNGDDMVAAYEMLLQKSNNGKLLRRTRSEVNSIRPKVMETGELYGDDRVAVYEMLLQKSNNGKLLRRTTTKVSRAFNISIRSIQRLWKRGKEYGNHNVSLKRVKNFGRKRVEIDWKKIRDIPLRKRTTLRNLSTILRVLKSEDIRQHTNAIKPNLTKVNRLQRI